MKQQVYNFCQTLLTLLLLLPTYQVFGADNEDTLTQCYPNQTTTTLPLEIPVNQPICEGTIDPSARATFQMDTGKLILPAVRVNQKTGYVYSLELNLLSMTDESNLTFAMTHYCLMQKPTSLPPEENIAKLTLPPGQLRIPTIDIGETTYFAALNVQQPSTQVWAENEIFTRQKETESVIFVASEIRQKGEKPNYPVLLVHGLNSSGETWKIYQKNWSSQRQLTYGGNIYIRDKYHLFEPGENANQNSLNRRVRSDYFSFFELKVKKDEKLIEKPSADFYTMNFSNNNDISFAAQGLELKMVVNNICEWTGSEGVYVVSHSMGGLATRAYLQLFNDQKVKGLITIGTPHYGSRDDFLGKLGSSLVSGDITEQLKQNSNDLNILNEDCSPLDESCPLPTADVEYFFIVVRGQSNRWIPFAGKKESKYSDDQGDGVVPINSQWIENIGNKSKEVLIENNIQVHTLETYDTDIEQLVWDKLIEWSN